MGIFKRIGNLIKSNASDMVTRAEDPERMLNQAIVDMGQQLGEAKKRVAEAIADEKRLHRQWETELERSKGWKERESQKNAVEQLKSSLRSLNDKIEGAKRKRNLLIAKKKRADAQKSVQETMSSMDAEGTFETFERMERRIEQSEAEAESAAELAGERTGDTLSERFAQLESKNAEDVELLALKEELGLLSSGREEEEERPQLEAGKREDAGAKGEAEGAADDGAPAGEEDEDLAEVEAAEASGRSRGGDA
jgi:phage shock protein A